MVQKFTLFIILKEKTPRIWEQKIDWIAEHGGMVVLNTHPDYMNFDKNKCGREEYPVEFYLPIIRYVQEKSDNLKVYIGRLFLQMLHSIVNYIFLNQFKSSELFIISYFE